MAENPAAPSYLPLVRRLAYGLRHRAGVKEGDHLLIACSGGADSVALLRGLHLLQPRRRWNLTLTVGHVNHRVRPAAESDADQIFVESLAERLGLTCRVTPLEGGVPPGDNVEAALRDRRYEALGTMAERCGATLIATGHHADDQLETVLMALLRGTTARGLRGIAPRRTLSAGVALIRPMLDATHAEAVSFLQQLNQPWREDVTNEDRTRTRARLRHEVLPVLRELRPSVARKAVELGDVMRGEVGRERGDV
jgi:tRNA(Ile)-lysidine synthase